MNCRRFSRPSCLYLFLPLRCSFSFIFCPDYCLSLFVSSPSLSPPVIVRSSSPSSSSQIMRLDLDLSSFLFPFFFSGEKVSRNLPPLSPSSSCRRRAAFFFVHFQSLELCFPLLYPPPLSTYQIVSLSFPLIVRERRGILSFFL